MNFASRLQIRLSGCASKEGVQPTRTSGSPRVSFAGDRGVCAGLKVPQPAMDTRARIGQALFEKVGCSACHRSTMTTLQAPNFTLIAISFFTIWVTRYRMGDQVPRQRARFRTAPLWGLGSRVRAGNRFLHDARAATPETAILWHDGEGRLPERIYRTGPCPDTSLLYFFWSNYESINPFSLLIVCSAPLLADQNDRTGTL